MHIELDENIIFCHYTHDLYLTVSRSKVKVRIDKGHLVLHSGWRGWSNFCMIILPIESIENAQYDYDPSRPLLGQKGQNRFSKVKFQNFQRSRSFSVLIRFSDLDIFVLERAHQARHFDTKHDDLCDKGQGQTIF